MGRAVLQIALDGGADIQRAFGRIVGDVRRFNAALSAESRRQSQAELRVLQEQERTKRAVLLQELRLKEQVANRTAAVAHRAVRAAAADEAQRTRLAQSGAVARATIAEREARTKLNVERALTLSIEREERARTRLEQRERRTRRDQERAERGTQRELTRERRVIGGVVRRVGTAALQVGEDVHAEVQGARRSRATTEHTLNAALREIGATPEEAVQYRRRVYEFVRSPQGAGISSEDLATGLAGAQERFSSLAAPTAPARRARLENALRTATFARNTYQDVGEVLRLQGALAEGGFSPETQQAALRSLVAISAEGGVRLSSLSAQNLGAVQSAMSTAGARVPNATPEQREAAQLNAALETVTALQVLHPRGFQGRGPGTQISTFTQALGTRQRQELILGRIRSQQGVGSEEQRNQARRLESVLYEADPDRRGSKRLRSEYQTFATFGRVVSDITGNDPSRFMDIFGGGVGRGRGGHATVAEQRVQGILLPPRRLIASLMGRDEAGRSGFEEMERIQRARLTPEDIARGEALVQSEQQTELTVQNERHIEALLENTKMLSASNELERFRTEHPVIRSIANQVPGGALVEGVYAGLAGTGRRAQAEAEATPAPVRNAIQQLVSQNAGGAQQVALTAETIQALARALPGGQNAVVTPQQVQSARTVQAAVDAAPPAWSRGAE